MTRTVMAAAFLLMATTAGYPQDRTEYIEPVPPILLSPGAPSLSPLDIEVDAFVRIPEARATFDVDGKGLAVVVIDSGLNKAHMSFPRTINGENFSSDNPSDKTDTNDDDADDLGPYRPGHGSHVAGIIVGADLPPANGIPSGVAPEAHVVPLKVFPGVPGGVKVKEALEWVAANHESILDQEDIRIGVVNMSLGTRQNLKTAAGLAIFQEQERDAIKALRNLGIAVVISAGNHYFHFDSETGMSFPAIVPEGISVGALYDSEIGPRADGNPIVAFQDGGRVNKSIPGRLTVFTQRLSEAEVGIHRTDVFAPGFLVTSAGPFLDGGGQDPSSTRSIHGTSQAAPVVSGLVLLLQQRYLHHREQMGLDPKLPPVDLIESCLREGGVVISDPEDGIAMGMDNVTSSGANDLIQIDAVTALETLDQKVTDQLHELRLELFNAESEAKQMEVLEAAPLLAP